MASLTLYCLPGGCAKADEPMTYAMIETVLVSCAWGEHVNSAESGCADMSYASCSGPCLDLLLESSGLLQKVDALGRMLPYEFPSLHCAGTTARRQFAWRTMNDLWRTVADAPASLNGDKPLANGPANFDAPSRLGDWCSWRK